MNIKRIVTSKRFRIALSLGLGALALYLAIQNVEVIQVWEVLRRARLQYVILAFGSVSFNAISKTARWQILLNEKKRTLTFGKLFGVLLVGQMMNNLFPARLGDLGRAYVAGGHQPQQPSRTFVFGTVVVEKIFDLFFYLLLFATVIILVPEQTWISRSIYSVTAVALVAISIFAIIVNFPNKTINLVKKLLSRFPEKIYEIVLPRVRSGMASLEVMKKRGDLLKVIFWSTLVWGTSILNNYLILLALNISVPFVASLLILVALQAGISVPSVPGWIGIFEYICIMALEVFGIGQNLALSYGLLLHGIVLVPAIIAGVVSLWLLGGLKEFLSSKEINSIP